MILKRFFFTGLPGFLTFALLSLKSFAGDPVQFHFYTITDGNSVETFVRYPGDLTKIRIEGLSPATRYTLKASLLYFTDILQTSVDLESDVTGVIDTAVAQPLSGSYDQADPDGLFWSMASSGVGPSISPNYQFTLESSSGVLGTAKLPLGFLQTGVQTVSLNGTGLVGTLYLPSAPGPHPAVIAFGGSEGGTATGEESGAWLANHGFVALGLGYFGAPGLPSGLANIPLEYFQKAIQFLQARPDVLANEIGVMGISRGGELAFLLGATFPEIKAVVAQVPSPVRWGGNTSPDSSTGQWPPAWTYHGAALTYISPTTWLTAITLPDGRTAYNNRPVFEAGLQEPQDVVAAATSAIEQTNGPIFMFGAEDDQVWPSCDLIDLAMKRLQANHHAYPDQAICYPGAGHSVGLIPGVPTMETVLQEGSYLLNLGGTPKFIAAGQRDAWAKTLEFLRANLTLAGK